MPVILGLCVAAIVVFLVVRAAPWRARRGPRIRCDGCAHLRRRFDDGAMCGYGSKEVFKTLAHIRMCGDREPASKR